MKSIMLATVALFGFVGAASAFEIGQTGAFLDNTTTATYSVETDEFTAVHELNLNYKPRSANSKGRTEMKSLVSTLAMLLFLTGCATGRNVQILEVCPRVPVLELEVGPDALERDWQGQMQLFLQGTLPMQPGLGKRLPHVLPTQERSSGR